MLSGLFSRACRSLGDAEKARELVGEVVQLRSVLADKFIQVASNMDGADRGVWECVCVGGGRVCAHVHILQVARFLTSLKREGGFSRVFL